MDITTNVYLGTKNTVVMTATCCGPVDALLPQAFLAIQLHTTKARPKDQFWEDIRLALGLPIKRTHVLLRTFRHGSKSRSSKSAALLPNSPTNQLLCEIRANFDPRLIFIICKKNV